MSKNIYFPGSLCPLHLWHEDLIKKVQDKTWNELYFSIKAGKKILKWIKSKNKSWDFKEKINNFYQQEKFLSLEQRLKILKYRYGDVNTWNIVRNNLMIHKFDGIVLWSDNFNLLIQAIENWKQNLIPFKKIYLCERIWYKVLPYKQLLKLKWIDLEIVHLWIAKYDIKWKEIRETFYKYWIDSIRNYVSTKVFEILRQIK